MIDTLIQAIKLISTWEVIIAMLAASVYGLVIGSLPGLSATMATALLVPVTFYLSPIAAIATIVAASSMAIVVNAVFVAVVMTSLHTRSIVVAD